MVHGGVRHGRSRARRRRGEDVELPAPPPGRVPHDLRQHHRAAARAEPTVDLRARDESIHDGARAGEARHRDRGREEQAERGGASGRAPRPGRHHGRGRARVRDARVAGPAARRVADLRRGDRDRDGERGRRVLAHRPSDLDARRGLEPRHDLLDEPRPRVPGVRGERGAHGVLDGRDHRAAEAAQRGRAVRPLRLQGTPSFGGASAVRPRQGARGRARRRAGPRRGSPVVSERRAARRREPDRRGRADEGRGALLAAPGRGRRAPGARQAGARARTGVGRPDAGGNRGGDGNRRRSGDDGDASDPACRTASHPAE